MAVRQQKRVCDHMLNHRILLQKPLVCANQMARDKAYLDKLIKKDAELASQQLDVKRKLKSYVKDLAKFQAQLSKSASSQQKLITESDDLFEMADSNWRTMTPFLEQTIDRWSSRYKQVELGSKKGVSMLQ